jgi:hypothetical protein
MGPFSYYGAVTGPGTLVVAGTGGVMTSSGSGLVATTGSLQASGLVESLSDMKPGPCMRPLCTRPSSLTVPLNVHVVSDGSIHEIVKLMSRP